MCFSLGAGASVSLLAEADKLDTLDLALLDRGLVTLRRMVLEHKPRIGGHRGRLRGALSTQTVGGVRGGGQGQQRCQPWRRRRGALLIRRRGQWGRGTLTEGVTGLMMGANTWKW